MSTFQQTFHVTGMTCGHCVSPSSRRSAPSPASTAVTVELASGDVDGHQRPRDRTDEVAAAIDEAGYELAS